MSYIDLDSTAAVDEFLTEAAPQWVFKHSNTCGISFHAKEAVDAYLARHQDERAAMVVVQQHRDVSNHIAAVLGHSHKSPQLFLVQDGQVLWTASHYSISIEAMTAARAAVA